MEIAPTPNLKKFQVSTEDAAEASLLIHARYADPYSLRRSLLQARIDREQIVELHVSKRQLGRMAANLLQQDRPARQLAVEISDFLTPKAHTQA